LDISLSIAFLPYITHTYEIEEENPWCSIPHLKNTWPIWFLYSSVWCFLLVSVGIYTFICCKLYNFEQMDSFRKVFFNTIGFYACAGFFIWVPRSILRFTQSVETINDNYQIFMNYYGSYLPIACEGIIIIIIIFLIIFISQERHVIIPFETSFHQPLIGLTSSLSWERDDFFTITWF
jgi:hypothetical protein